MTYNHFQIQKLLKEQGIIKQLVHLLHHINPDIIQKYIGSEYKEVFKIKGSIKIVKGFTAEILTDLKNI